MHKSAQLDNQPWSLYAVPKLQSCYNAVNCTSCSETTLLQLEVALVMHLGRPAAREHAAQLVHYVHALNHQLLLLLL